MIFQTLYLWEKGSYILLQFDSGRGGEVGGQRYPKPPQTKNWEGQSPPRFEPKNTFTDVFDNTCDISYFKAHIFCPQTTQELPKKHNEAEPSEPPEPSTAY